VVISPSDAASNALESGSDLDKEVCFLVVHGILHLVGHDHMKPGEKRRMFAEQKKLMRIFAGGRSSKPQWDGCIRRMRSSDQRKAKVAAGNLTRKRRK
jgi:probable rRNA maturation factor